MRFTSFLCGILTIKLGYQEGRVVLPVTCRCLIGFSGADLNARFKMVIQATISPLAALNRNPFPRYFTRSTPCYFLFAYNFDIVPATHVQQERKRNEFSYRIDKFYR